MKQKNGVIVLSIIIIVLGVLYWYWAELIPRSIRSIVTPPASGPVGEDMTAKQLQELEALRKQSGLPAPTQSDIARQLQELEALRKKSNIPPPSEAEISKQLEELEKLRKSK